MTGNISKANGLRGYRGYTGKQGEHGEKGEKGDTVNVYFRYNEETGELFYITEYVPSLTTAPYIGENGNWYVFDGVSKTFIDSGVSASGGGGSGSDIPTKYIDEYINSQTAAIKADIEGIRQQMNNEAHFRGYLSTNAKIQALKATPNDFAYSAESGTKWLYDVDNDGWEGWFDTGMDVPDQLTPRSETIPLPNGLASAGKENAYASGDHIHPTDETRASAGDVAALQMDVLSLENTVDDIWDKLEGVSYTLDDIIALQNSYVNGGDGV